MLEKLEPMATGSITYCTTGIVMKRLQSDPLMKRVSHVILDEVHERQSSSDFAMAVARRLLRVRKDMKLILMSATMKTEHLLAYFAEFNPEVLDIEGKLHEVKELYLEDVLTELDPYEMDLRGRFFERDFKGSVLPKIQTPLYSDNYHYKVVNQIMDGKTEDMNVALIGALIKRITLDKPEGGILVFVNGESPMWDLENELYSLELMDKLEAHWLLSKYSSEIQMTVFDPPEAGKRKLVVATNIAETSITIPDIVYVIDTGKVNVRHYETRLKAAGLPTEWVSKSSARQRKGRAGRKQAGICYRLYTRARFEVFAEESTPETKRARLEDLALDIKRLKLGREAPR